MNWTGGEGSNMRLCRTYTGSSSYQSYCLQNNCSSSGSDSGSGSGSGDKKDDDSETTIIVIVVVVVVVILIGMAAMYIKRRNKQGGASLSSQDYNQMG